MKKILCSLLLALIVSLGSAGCSDKHAANEVPTSLNGNSVAAKSAIAISDGVVIDGSYAIENWELFTASISSKLAEPPSASQGDVVGPSGKLPIKLNSVSVARFALSSKRGRIAVAPGERYRVSAWIKGDNVALSTGSRGLLLRATLFTATGKDAPNGHFYLGEKGAIIGSTNKYGITGVTDSWKKIEGVFEVPAGVSFMYFFIYCWNMSGTFYFDDPKVEKMDIKTSLTPLL